MDISLISKLKKYDEFIKNYTEGDEKKLYKGKSLLFFSLSNNDIESRYLITSFLIDKGADVNVINENCENLLHILFSRISHNIQQTTELCKRLIDNGVDVNQFDNKERVPFQYLINSRYTDEELEPIYNVLFDNCKILINHKNVWGKTPLELVEEMPYRKKLLERLTLQ